MEEFLEGQALEIYLENLKTFLEDSRVDQEGLTLEITGEELFREVT